MYEDFVPFCLGKFKITRPWIMAPIAGYTNWPFQVLCRRRKLCDLTFTPMVCAQAFAFLSSRSSTLKLLDWDDSCGPIAVQLFGDNPEYMAKASKYVVERGASLIDINMGCTVPKIIKKRSGVALLRYPDIACRIVEAISSSVEVPITVKMRLGWNIGDEKGLILAKRLKNLGVSAFFVHARYGVQGFSGNVYVKKLEEWCSELNVPIIGNGDILRAEDVEPWEKIGCSGVMIGRGILGDPWLLERLEASRLKVGISDYPDIPKVVATIREHLELIKRYTKLTEIQTVQEFRCHLAQYCHKHRCILPWRKALLDQRNILGLEMVLDSMVVASENNRLKHCEFHNLALSGQMDNGKYYEV